jgi:hypothetical protein
MIHGAGDAFPKGELIIRRGSITMRILPTVQRDDSQLFADSALKTSRNFRSQFMKDFASFVAEVRTVDYCKNIVLRNYIYKGYDVWKSVKKSLNSFIYQPENYRNLHQVFFDNCDYGATAFLVALMNADVQVIAKDATEFIDVARNCREVPENLRYEDYAS